MNQKDFAIVLTYTGGWYSQLLGGSISKPSKRLCAVVRTKFGVDLTAERELPAAKSMQHQSEQMQSFILQEEAKHGETFAWRRRALDAETKLQRLRRGLRNLLESSSDLPMPEFDEAKDPK